jgi:nicotinate-nucleotide pyrophosphorylase (carboxylating)
LNIVYLNDKVIDAFIDQSLMEDVGPGDYSSIASIPSDATKKARLIIKEKGILAGLALAEKIFKKVDSSLEIDFFMVDGQKVRENDIAFHVSGRARSILMAERLVLNCMQRMSGIATLTNEYVNKIQNTNARILDTRKTTPNFRIMEKWAVVIGGGFNHRFGLYDMILLKDNHIDFAGGIAQAIESTENYLKEHNLNLKIEIETRSLKEVTEVLKKGGIHRIMLDNMDCITMQKAVRLINKQYETEASGGVNLQSVAEIAQTGVDYISVGALTHSANSIDLSLKALK